MDFYHAVEHLGKAASLRKNWKKGEKQRWITKHRKLLKEGKVEKVIEAIREICRGCKSKGIRKEMNYFIRNQNRMNYAMMKDLLFPLGSGSMESSIRRVVNLRMKGAGIFWERENVDAMLLLRSFYKAGRWETLKRLAFSHPLPAI